nr:MAG TPA: hypothetical protein [Caudoviricetes sp.]
MPKIHRTFSKCSLFHFFTVQKFSNRINPTY